MKERQFFAYLLMNQRNTVIYTGVTNNLNRRLAEHRKGVMEKSFTKRYNVNKLVYYEVFSSIIEAITREKQIKAGSRNKKLELIKSINPKLNELLKDS